MTTLSSLPRALLTLTLAQLAIVPVLAVSISFPPTSTNDPFRAVLVVHRAHQPEPPLCCLKPLPTIDPPEAPEDILLSFEEWKSKVETPPESDTPSKTRNDHVPPTEIPSPSADISYPYSAMTEETLLPPHFRVPVTDRFNYANMDCSARVHTSHKSAKSASSILSSKKDKYMLSPCSADPQFIVVELCDDIRIDTVQLANFEFFSGVFEDFSVSVAKTYTDTDEGWTPAGEYHAKNVRGVQSFHPPTSLHDFYRFIRIDFHSHYGHEYYCPVSLLRVYGLTHLEEWKWDMWLAESRERLKDSALQRTLVESSHSPESKTSASVILPETVETRPFTSLQSSVEVATPIREASSSHSSLSAHANAQGHSSHSPEEATLVSSGDGTDQHTSTTPFTEEHSVTEAISSLLSMSSPLPAVLPTPPTTEHSHFSSQDPDIHIVATVSSQPSHSPMQSSVLQPSAHTQSVGQWSGESIYRTIMNRLTILEANHTLYARYVEEQTARVREVLKKVNEEIGRLESVSRMQAQMYQRTVHEWERQRLRLELEHGELLSRVNYLSNEVALEKRLGIAQLSLLLAVLVFIGLTRGAPPAHHPPQTMHRSRHGWGVRSLSFGSSADGWNFFKGQSRSLTEPRRAEAGKATDAPPIPFEQTGSPSPKPRPQLHTSTLSFQHAAKTFKSSIASTAASSHKRVPTTFRTPTKRPLLTMDHNTLPRAEPLARSHSSSTSGFAYARSAKRWARTAHLHEIKVERERRGSGGGGTGSGGGRRSGVHRDKERENRSPDREDSLDDVFGGVVSSTLEGAHGIKNRSQSRVRVLSGPRMGSLEGSTDGDAWIDTDVDVDVDPDEDESCAASDVVLSSPVRAVFEPLS